MGITNHEKRALSTFFLSLHLHKLSQHKTKKTKPHVLHVLPSMRGGEGRSAVIQAPIPLHGVPQEEVGQAICKQQSHSAFLAMVTQPASVRHPSSSSKEVLAVSTAQIQT